METNTLEQIKPRGVDPASADLIRQNLKEQAKRFKTSWLKLGQGLYPVWKDKLYYAWGYDKFEYYTERELGIKKSTSLKLLKTYFFLEQEEPAYLQDDFAEKRDAVKVPACDAMNVLRMARAKKELTRDDYRKIRQSVLDEGRDAGVVRKELTSLMKERKAVDPEEEREQRKVASIRRFLGAIKMFSRDMETLKLAPAELMNQAEMLMKRLEEEVE